MDGFARNSGQSTRLIALLLLALAAGCGGGGATDPAPVGASDNTPPMVSGTANANGAINVPINTMVGATFTEAMDVSTITTTTFFLMQGTTAVPGAVIYSGVSAVLTPSGSLTAATHYTVTLKGGTGGAKDLAGNPLAKDFVWAWTTSAGPDTTAPTVVGTVSPNGATNVAINTRIGATFSESMDPMTINAKTLFLMQGTAVVPGTVSYSGVSTVLIPASNLDPFTSYTVTLRGGAGGVKDLAGNAIASDYSWSWATGATLDTIAPTVVGTTVANGATNVGVNATIGATFSRAMDPLTITNVTCTLLETTSGAPAVMHTVSYSDVSVEFQVDGFGPLAPQGMRPSTGYTATIKGGIDGATDLAGNPLPSDYVWKFTTATASGPAGMAR
jgi:hypothetical protein